MPNHALKPCSQAGCRVLIKIGAYCEKHARKQKQITNVRRESSTQRGYGYKWQQASQAYLKTHPLCECDDCQAGKLRVRGSSVVDHRIPHKLSDALKSGDQNKIEAAQKLFWDRKNWCAMSAPCHNAKTAREDGGFGNRGGGSKVRVLQTLDRVPS